MTDHLLPWLLHWSASASSADSSEDDDRGNATTAMSANEWARRRDTILTIVLWTLAVGMVFWLLSHVGRVILLLVISGLIAFALAPLTKLLSRFLPRPLAIILVYCVMLGALGGLGYLVVSAALSEGASAHQPGAHFLVVGSTWCSLTPRSETH